MFDIPKIKVTCYDPEQQEIFNALIDYSMAQVKFRMLAYDEPFEVALANYIEEIQNEQVEKPTVR